LQKDSAPEYFTIPLLGDAACLDANLWYVATLAYPTRSERGQRELFVNALRAWRIKPAYKFGDRTTRTRMRRTFAASDLHMKNQKINGVNHKGMKRVANRILAGYWAWSLWSDGVTAFGANPTTFSGTGMVQLRGITTVVQGIRPYLREKAERTNICVEKESAEKNAWSLIWSESMPVLHLAVPLYLAISSLLVQRTKKNLRKLVEDLLLNPRWIVRALIKAEYWREKLPGRIPLFKPEKATQILQKAY